MYATKDVPVQVCGRRETVAVTKVTVRDLVAAVSRRFEVKPPFLIAAHDGRLLPDDDALEQYVITGNPVVVKLTEGVMHDFHRRIDQLRHLQWGFLSDQLALAKAGDGGVSKADHGRWRSALEQEHKQRLDGHDELQHGLDLLHDALRKERAARDAMLQTVEDKIADLELKIDKAQQPHEVAAATLQQGITELARSIGEERRHREHGEAMLRQERQELQAELRSEVASQQESGNRLRREIAQTQANVEAVQSAWRAEALELRQHFSDLRQALASEQQERAASEGRSTSAVHQAQRLVAQDAKDRSAELQALAGSVRSLEAAMDATKVELRRAQGDTSQQLTAASDRISEERKLRTEAASDLAQQLELVRRGLEHEGHERNNVSNAVERLMTELARRCDDEARARQAEVERLLRMVSDERERRHDSDMHRTPTGHADSSLEGSFQMSRSLREVRQELQATKDEVHNMLDAALRNVRDVPSTRASPSPGLGVSDEAWKADVAKLREDCKEAMQREVRSRIEREKILRDELERKVRELREGLENHRHELHVEGLGSSTTTVTTGVAMPLERTMQRRPSATSLARSGSGNLAEGNVTGRSSALGSARSPKMAGAAVMVQPSGPGGEVMHRRPSRHGTPSSSVLAASISSAVAAADTAGSAREGAADGSLASLGNPSAHT